MIIFYEWRCKKKPAHITKQTKPFSSLDIYSNSKVANDDRIKDYKAAIQQIRLDCVPGDGKLWQE